jgi:antibiotic biosynthesis monooxygenase (ABM) superfamily enzyme
MSATPRAPTVIVARSARPGREAEFETWLRELGEEASRAPGFIGHEVQQPDADRPRDWVTIYRFDSRERLARWLDSPERRTLMAAGADLLDGSEREQLVVLDRNVDPVTAVISVRVAPQHRREYLELYHQIDDAMSRAPGFVRTELFEPVPGTQEDTVVVFTFDGRDHLDAWLTSPERRSIIERMQPYIQTPHTVTVVGGFGGWFDLGGAHGPKPWKQAVVVLLALYPTVMVITLIDNWILPDPWLPIDVLIGNVIGVAILTWLVMPPLTRRLSAWLGR